MSQTPGAAAGKGRWWFADLFSAKNVPQLFCALVISNIGSWAQKVTLAWVVWENTSSATWISVLVTAEVVPLLLLSKVAGRIADRTEDPRRLLQRTYEVQLGATLVLAAVVYAGWISPPAMVGYILVAAAIQTFGVPLLQVVLADSFDRALLPRVSSVNSITYNVARFLGPMIAGLMLHVAAPWWTLFGNALTFVAPLVLLPRLVSIHARTPESVSKAVTVPGTWRDLLRLRQVGALYGLLFCTSLFGRPIVEHIASLSERWGTSSATGITWMTSCAGLGALAAGLWLMQPLSEAQRSRAVIYSALALGGLSALLVLSLPFIGVCLVFAGLGFSVVVQGVCTMGLLHLLTDQAVRGAAFALFNLLLRGGLAVGTLGLGALLDGQLHAAAFIITASVIGCAAVCYAAPIVRRESGVSSARHST